MAAGSTYTPISTTTLSSATASITLNSFSGYTDLFLVCNFGSSSASQLLQIQFNGDTASNYSATFMYTNSGGTSSARRSNRTSIEIWNDGADTGLTTNALISFMNYSNTTTYKTAVGRMNSNTSTYWGPDAGIGLWRSTSAITSMTLTLSGGPNFIVGSTFTLYGITAA